MIHKLSIQNYALIDNLDISFSDGMTIITGETGAGKSILLGALSLLIGNRADSSALLHHNKKCIIEGTFHIKDYPLQDFFQRYDLDAEELTTIRREINPEGKSRAFVNDTPVNLNILKELGNSLIEIHSQHETLTLNDSGFQMMIIDSYAKNSALLNKYRQVHLKHFQDIDRLADLKEKEHRSKLDADYFQFQFNELSDAKLNESEQKELEEELALLNNSEDIKTALSKASNTLNGDETNLITSWSGLVSSIQHISKVFPRSSDLVERLKALQIEIKDITSEIEMLEREVVYDPDRIELISDRLDTLYGLQKKHHVNSVNELLLVYQDLNNKLSEISSLDEEILALEKLIATSGLELTKAADALHLSRTNAIPVIEKTITAMLSDLGMKQAVLKIELESLPEGKYKSNGGDAVKFMFSANKGIAYRELNKVASGGELSRLMLCIKSMLAKSSGLPTIIFDEIDTGISGEIGHKVGKILKDMSSERQVIAITHLPQMAGKGDDHLYVYKETSGKITKTRIKKLNKDERVEEIAKMLSGDQPTRAAIANAKELLNA